MSLNPPQGIVITEDQISDLDHNDTDAIHDNVAGELNALTTVTGDGSDCILIEDASDSFNKKKILVSDLLGAGTDADAIHDNVAGEIAAVAAKTPLVGADLILIEDSADSNNKKSATIADIRITESQITDLDHTDADAIHDNVAGEIAAVTTKAVTAAADILLIEDSAAANAKKSTTVSGLRITESQITDLTHTDPDAIHDNVSGEIAAVAEKLSPVAADLVLLEDSAAANAKKRAQVGNLSGAIDHNSTSNYVAGEHRVINDGGTSTIELWSSDKIDSELSAIAAGVDIKAGVDTSTFGLGNITLSGEQTLNGLLTSGSRVLVLEQTLSQDNGVYVSAAGAWARAADADEDAEVTNGNITHVINSGSTEYKAKYLLVTPDPITVGGTAQTWERHGDITFGTTSGTATEGNDSRVPSQDENDALLGTNGTPSNSNRYVTDSDPRNTDSRAPTGAAGGDLAGTYPNPTVNDGADGSAIHDNVAAEVSAITAKPTTVAADILLIEDSAAGNAKKSTTVGGLRLTESQITDLTHTDADAIHDNVAGEVAAIAAKATTVGADILLIEDSAAGNAKKSTTVSGLRVTESQITDLAHTDADAIHDNVAGEISAVAEKTTPVSADLLLIEDSAAGNAKKRVQIGNLPSGNVTAAAAVADNEIVFGDTPVRGIKTTGFWVVDANGKITGTVSYAGYALCVRNNLASGELYEGLNHLGNDVFEVNTEGSGNGLMRVMDSAGTLAGLDVNGTGFVKIGPGSGGPDLTWPLLVKGALAGGNGLFVMAGEVEDDIAFKVQDADGTFDILEIHADNGQVVLGDTYLNTKTVQGQAYGVDNQHSGGVETDFNTQNGIYRVNGEPVATGDFVSGNSSITTTSTTHVLASGMTITPPAGVYMCSWSAVTSTNSSSDRQTYMQIYAGGAAQGSESDVQRGDSSTDNRIGQTVHAKVTVNGSQAIEGRWRTIGSTGEMYGRSLMIVSVAP